MVNICNISRTKKQMLKLSKDNQMKEILVFNNNLKRNLNLAIWNKRSVRKTENRKLYEKGCLEFISSKKIKATPIADNIFHGISK